MKVCILTATEGWGGTEVHAVALARMLEDRGHAVRIVQLGHNIYGRAGVGSSGRPKVVEVAMRKSVEEVNLIDALALLWPLRGDVAVFPKGEIIRGNWWLDLAARVCYRRYVTIEQLMSAPMPSRSSRRHLWGMVPGLSVWWYRHYLPECMRRYRRSIGPHRVVCVSEAIKRQLIQDYRFAARKVVTIHNGVDSNRFRRDPAQRTRARRAWGISEEALVFGAIGRFVPVKAYDVAIESFARLRRVIPSRDMWLVLVGEGPLRDALASASREQGVADRVRLMEFTERPWEVYCGFDLFLMPSRREGLPLALLEAMSCECSPIAMAVAGIPEVIADEDVGWLVPAGDRERFFAAMRKAAESDARALRTMGAKAREQVVARFDARVQLGRLARLIEEMVDGMVGEEGPERSWSETGSDSKAVQNEIN